MLKAKCNGLDLAAGPFKNRPAIKTLDCTGYDGWPGDRIRIEAAAKDAVDRVLVIIRSKKAGIVEEGRAVLHLQSGHWEYTATAVTPERHSFEVHATGVPREGYGTTTLSLDVTPKRAQLTGWCAGEMAETTVQRILKRSCEAPPVPAAKSGELKRQARGQANDLAQAAASASA